LGKIGRNHPCPCGSEKKYKKCHGGIDQLERLAQVRAAIPSMLKRHEAQEQQRREQQGLGRPIIATRMENGYQFVAVKDRLHFSQKWKTFHDFLINYIAFLLGAEWGNVELKKPLDQRHPILFWYHTLCEQQRLSILQPGQVVAARMTGAVAAYMNLAYDLYALQHNVDLQEKLIERLRNVDNFRGALYEVQVAAQLVRAGFTLAFENEDDRTSTHCEFTATNTLTGKKFSVEAKTSTSDRIIRPLVRALKKAADHNRVIFIGLNHTDPLGGPDIPPYVQQVFDSLRRYEVTDPAAKRLPMAYIFVTNDSWVNQLDGTSWRRMLIADGFRINDFKLDHVFPSLRAAIDSREAHTEMHGLLQSIRQHSEIPSTFDGGNPELAFVNTENRLLIGNTYMLPEEGGGEVECILQSAVVVETEKIAFCGVNTFDGRGILVRVPLSESELAAWKRHPDTFFGEMSRGRKIETVLDMYDFLMKTYSKSSKVKLLEFLKGSLDIAELAKLDQAELAKVYCERIAIQSFAWESRVSKPVLQTKWRIPTSVHSNIKKMKTCDI
jgi:hypothetical protein